MLGWSGRSYGWASDSSYVCACAKNTQGIRLSLPSRARVEGSDQPIAGAKKKKRVLARD